VFSASIVFTKTSTAIFTNDGFSEILINLIQHEIELQKLLMGKIKYQIASKVNNWNSGKSQF
jgi:hypothetical protein